MYGISGLARNGKDVLSEIIKKYTGYNTYAFADPIKKIAERLFKWDYAKLYGDEKETHVNVFIDPLSHKRTVTIIRECIGQYGNHLTDNQLYYLFIRKVFKSPFKIIFGGITGWYRITPRQFYQRFGTDFARGLQPTIWVDLAPKYGIIISDIRFENEADMVRENGGKIIHIVRENYDNGNTNSHNSESGIERNSNDEYVTNIDSVDWYEHLESEVKRILGIENG